MIWVTNLNRPALSAICLISPNARACWRQLYVREPRKKTLLPPRIHQGHSRYAILRFHIEISRRRHKFHSSNPDYGLAWSSYSQTYLPSKTGVSSRDWFSRIWPWPMSCVLMREHWYLMELETGRTHIRLEYTGQRNFSTRASGDIVLAKQTSSHSFPSFSLQFLGRSLEQSPGTSTYRRLRIRIMKADQKERHIILPRYPPE